MYSTYKYKILKRLKYIIAVLLFITILPGNAGVKDSKYQVDREIDSLINENLAGKESTDKVSNSKDEIKSDPVNIYLQQSREISPINRSFNFFLSVQ